MPEIKKVEIETSEPAPAPAPPPSDRTIDMAVEYGRMTKAFENNQTELIEVKSGLQQACDLIRNQNEVIQSLRSQTQSAQNQAESARVAAAAAIVATEEKEEDGGVLEVSPEVETRIEIEQKPASSRRWFHNLIFGK